MAEVIDLLSSDEEGGGAVAPAAPPPPPSNKRPLPAQQSYDLSDDVDSEPAAAAASAAGDSRHALTIQAEGKLAVLISEVDDYFASVGLVDVEAPNEPDGKRHKGGGDGGESDTGGVEEERLTMEGLMAHSAAELRAKCRDAYCPALGTKAVMSKRLLAREQSGGKGEYWQKGTGFGGVDSMNASDDTYRAKGDSLTQQRGERKLGQRLQTLRMGLPVGSFAPDIRPVLRGSASSYTNAILLTT